MNKRSRTAELAALTSIAARVNCTQDLDEILTGALETTLDVVGESSGAIFLIEEETEDLILFVHRGLSEQFVEQESIVGAGQCLCGLAVKSGEPLRVQDLESHPARSRMACLLSGYKSCIRLPLRARGKVIGLLNIQSRSGRIFTQEDEDLLTAIGHQIGIAIANARLIEDAEQRRATLESVMRSMVDGLLLLDPQGRILYSNPCAERMLGSSRLALAGQLWDDVLADLIHSGTIAKKEMAELDSVGETPHAAPITELSLHSPEPRTIQSRPFRIYDARRDYQGLGILLRDVTRERELDQMKSQLLSTVSHELRTPLASIKGFATTLLRQDVEWDEDSRREFLSIIDNESDRLSELIGNLLDMSRIEAGTLRVEPEPIDLRAIVQSTLAEFEVMTHLHRFAADLPGRLPLVSADPRRTRQVLRNLLENAVKYSPQGGLIQVDVAVDGAFVRTSVVDQGLGIDPQHIDQIFARFYQVDSASTRQVGGAGLGLSICKAIVEAQGGRIWAESQPGVGSTFHFTSPIVLTGGENGKKGERDE